MTRNPGKVWLTLKARMSTRPAPRLRPLATMCLIGVVLFALPVGERLALGAGFAGAANSHPNHLVPMFPAAADGVRQGFVRIINRSPRAGDVHIEAYDYGGTRFGPVTLDIDADETVHFNSADLEDGNAAKGLATGTGPGAGDWWLALSSDLDIEVLSYIRTPADGFLTSMHDVVPADGEGGYRVAFFNPGSNTGQVSMLRLVNAGNGPAQVTITGIDDRGVSSSGGSVAVSVPAGASRTLSAGELEAGGAGFEGELGNGAGKWQLLVQSSQPVTVMSLLSSPTGHLTNLSTAPAANFAPAGAAAFADRVVGNRIVGADPASYVDFAAGGRFRETEGADTYEGSYTYSRTGTNLATVVFNYDDGETCTYELAFASRTSGTLSFTCDEGAAGESPWRLVALSGGETKTYGTGEIIDTLPAGSWSFDRLGGGVGFRTVGGEPDIDFDEGGYLERGSYRYTCESAGGCRIEGRDVTAGQIVQTPLGGPGGGSRRGPDLVVDTPSASDTTVQPDAAFTLTATVRNLGNERAAQTTLRYYRSSNATISTVDTEVGSVSADALDASTGREQSIDVTAPADPGTYYYGACVDHVDGESNTANNCSAAVTVTVTASTMPNATCEVDLRRSSSAGGTATVSFTLSEARPAPVGTSNVQSRIDADMDGASDFDVYEIALNAAGWLTVLSGSALDTQAVFLAEDCTEVDSVDIVEDVGQLPGIDSSNLNFGLSGDVNPGSYYLAVFEWAGRTGDYTLGITFDDPLVNDAPLLGEIAGQEMAPGGSATVLVEVSDDRGDTHRVSAESSDAGIATVTATRTAGGDPALAIAAVAVGTTTISVGATDQHGASATPVVFEVVVRSPTLAAPTVGPAGAAGELEVAVTATFGPRETRAYDYQLRRKRPQSPWASVCVRWTNNGTGELTASASRTFAGLPAGVTFEVRYRYRGGSSCSDGTPGRWSAVGEGASRAQAAVFELDTANRSPSGIVHANGILHVLDQFDGKVYAYTSSGARDADKDFDLSVDNTDPEGITYADGRFFVVDDADGKVFAYHPSGPRDTTADFDLHNFNDSPVGITYAGGRFYVIDDSGSGTVFVYRRSGERDAAAEFDLDANNDVPGGFATTGITHAGGRVFVVDWIRTEVFAFRTSGERQPAFDFDLDADNRRPEGIAYGNGNFHVVDDTTHRIFVYAEDGGAAAARLNFPEGIAADRAIPENIPAGINVGAPVSADGDEGLVYTLAGPDAGSFDLLGDTGQIRTKDGVAYDYETKNRHVVEVRAADGDGNRASIEVTIHIVDLAPACASRNDLNLRTNHSDGRLTLRWDPLAARTGHAPVQGYETEIRRGAAGTWTDRRTFLGRNITAAVYGNLDNEVSYQVRARPINAEGDCDWSTPVSGIPTADRAPRDDDEYHDRFGPHPVGTAERNLRLLTPGRCRHTLDGVNLDADCTYERTGPHAGRISLEFDDPSRGSCDVALAYSSLTAGSFIDECFDAGVNTNVAFDRSFRMPPLSDQDDGEEVPRAPRSQEEFDVLAWGRDDFIPGLGFGCAPVFDTCTFTPGHGYTVGRDADTGLAHYVLGEYTYMNTGPSTGVLTFRDDTGTSYRFTLDFGAAGSVRATVEAPGGDVPVWPGIPHLDLTLGAQPVLLLVPPYWSAAIAIETDFAPDQDNWHRMGDAPDRSLLGNTYGRLFTGDFDGLRYFRSTLYEKRGRNRATLTYTFGYYAGGGEEAEYQSLDDFQKEVFGSTWVFDLTFTSDGAARFTLTITKEGHLPTVVEGVVDFHGDGISVDEFPEELLLPEDPPQASGEDVSGVEVAAAVTTTRIGGDDLLTLLVSASGADYRSGDWLEPKDGSNQRMMIVGAGQGAVVAAVDAGQGAAVAGTALSAKASQQQGSGFVKTGAAFPLGETYALAAAMAIPPSHGGEAAPLVPGSAFTRLTVVCMQQDQGIPSRGDRYFSRAKIADGEVQLCQKDCVLNEGSNIQACVWECEADAMRTWQPD